MMEFDPVLVHEWLSCSSRRFPGKEALICGEERWTYAELDAVSTRLALSLARVSGRNTDELLRTY